MLPDILSAYGLHPDENLIEPFGSGLINHTWKVTGDTGTFILQQINKNIFKHPHAIADNLLLLDEYFNQNAPGYIFPAPLATTHGRHLVQVDGEFYRLLPFVKKSHTVNAIDAPAQAYEAARQFGKFSRLLHDFDASHLKYTLPDFHNLNLRVEQFNTALQNATSDRLSQTLEEVKAIQANADIADTYRQLVQGKQIPLRVIHHDTKINNVLFDDNHKGLCVIDLDTVMPGYYISDVGDMMRTYLSAANEEEQDLEKVQVSTDNFGAIHRGYMNQMGDVLTAYEKSLFIYSGKFMIYMQALRFLTDYLNGDVYYHTQYPGHNLKRAQNQLTLLNRYLQAEETFKELIAQ